MLGADSSASAKEGVLSYNEVKLIGLNQVNFEPACHSYSKTILDSVVCQLVLELYENL